MTPKMTVLRLSILLTFVAAIGSYTSAGAQSSASQRASGVHASGVRASSNGTSVRPLCQDNAPLCTEVLDSLNYDGQYTGHDEPSNLFYSNVPGSGNSNQYRLTLPRDPSQLPTQDGQNGTFNFQLQPAFWFGMALCDTQSAPEYTPYCTPDSDSNIFDAANPANPKYIGHHPGTAFMEMQFYPPGWVLWPAGNSCDAAKWCAALNIFSYSNDQNNNVNNNTDCLDKVGIEPANFAFITTSGTPHAPPNPLAQTLATFTPNSATDLFMNSGDQVTVDMHDTADGFHVVINDLTTAQSGSMTTSIANGFGQVVFNPTATTCTVNPYAFHPMYATSSEHTRVPWAAHSYNVAFADEIGHFQYCSAVSSEGGSCTASSPTDPGSPDADDTGCFSTASSSFVQIGGCIGTDFDFDGVPYQKVWPGTNPNPIIDARYHPTPIRYTSPHFNGTGTYDRVALEVDLPRVELNVNPACNRTTGQYCTKLPVGANFYPIFSNGTEAGRCVWQFGGAFIPRTTNRIGVNSVEQYGSLLQSVYPGAGGQPIYRFNNFRRVLENPC